MKHSPTMASHRKNAEDESLRLKTILAPMDFSEHSVWALRYAVRLAEKVSGKVIALNVVSNPVVYPAFTAEDQQAFVNEAQQRLYHACQADSIKTEVETMIRIGVVSVAEEIALAARDIAADLIVVPAHPPGGFVPSFFAHTADRIAQHAPCPVLMVPVVPLLPGKLEEYSE